MKDEDLVILECALDTYYYEHALASVSGNSPDETLIRDLIRTEIDTINLKTVLRLVRDKVDPQEARRFFLDGGKEFDSVQLLSFMEFRSVEEILEDLDPTSFRFLAKVSDSYARTGRISVYEKELDRFLVQSGVRAFYRDPLSIAPAVGYFWAKFNETINIRIISRCKTADMSETELTEELVYV
jgi:V/A-type H+-transporting ATPase subunit C